MVPAPNEIPAEYLSKLDINGMHGRVLHLPGPKSKKAKRIVLLGGQHVSHERLFSVSQYLNRNGEVFSPDLPGFGGMDSFYKIGQKPTIENYADYLYTFLKSHGLTEGVSLVANSLSMRYVVYMLHKYPETRGWIVQLVGLVTFADSTNFIIPPFKKAIIYAVSIPGSTRLGGAFFDRLVFNRVGASMLLKAWYFLTLKWRQADRARARAELQMDIHLWATNESRTHGATALEMFRLNLTDLIDEQLDMMLFNVISENDQYFDNERVKASYERLFREYRSAPLNIPKHSPRVIDTPDDVEQLIPDSVKDLLAS